MKQTAVQWLQQSLSLTFEQQMQFEGLFQQAKEMEKQQQGYSEEEVKSMLYKCYCGHTTYCDCGPKEEINL